jgi:dipeptidase E
MNLLLISNSTNAGEQYLQYPIKNIASFLEGVSEVVFVPYAAVTFSYAAYEAKVQARFDEIGIKVRSVHRAKDPRRMIREAQAICVGGGNTFALAKKMQEQGLMKAILKKIKEGTPYVGWSAGSNVACPTICTTNDMPIVEPESFKAIGAVKFQINPHYLDDNPEGHAGETR